VNDGRFAKLFAENKNLWEPFFGQYIHDYDIELDFGFLLGEIDIDERSIYKKADSDSVITINIHVLYLKSQGEKLPRNT
jgi:hypothetical protein